MVILYRRKTKETSLARLNTVFIIGTWLTLGFSLVYPFLDLLGKEQGKAKSQGIADYKDVPLISGLLLFIIIDVCSLFKTERPKGMRDTSIIINKRSSAQRLREPWGQPVMSLRRGQHTNGFAFDHSLLCCLSPVSTKLMKDGLTPCICLVVGEPAG